MDEKGIDRRIWNFLGSRDFSVFIFIMGLTYTFILVIFGMLVPVPWVNNLSKLLPFKVLYILFFVNLIICEIKWLPVIIIRCRKNKKPETIEDMERFRHQITVQSSESKVQEVEKYLKWRGYRVRSQKSELRSQESGEKNFSLLPHSSLILHASKGRFSPLGNLFFHISFLFLLCGVGVSSLFRFEGGARVPEGYDFSGSIPEYSVISASPLASTPKLYFSLEKISPKFWEGQLLFTDLKADIKYQGGTGSAWISSPLKIDKAKVTINSISISPMYILKNKEGKELDRGYVNLAVFVPGSEDHFQIPGYPHQIYVSFYPDHEVRDGQIINRSMELKNPAYFIKVYRGKLLVFSGLIRQGEEATFESLRLSFPEMRYWGEFRIIKDPGFVFIWTAFILFGIGLIWRLLFYKREIAVIKKGDAVYLLGNSDYYQILFESRLQKLARMISEK